MNKKVRISIGMSYNPTLSYEEFLMLERILKLLDSCKEKQVSKILHDNRLKMLALLNGPYFSNRIKPYFAKTNEQGPPFKNFAKEPKQINQIKEIYNALYHAEKAFLDLETIDLRRETKKEVIKKLYYNTIYHAYQASYLLTHLDVDLNALFNREIKLLLPLLSGLQQSAVNYANDAAVFTNQLKQYPVGYKAGLMSGIAVDQMKPGSGEIDYSFLTQFSALLPGYIQQFRAYIYEYSPQALANFQPTIDQDKLDALQSEGAKLLTSLENLKGDSVLLSAKLVYYVDIIERIISLSMSTLEQMTTLNESSQDVIRENIGLLKYQLLTSLLAFADRLEDEALLTPGTLSNPLMAQLRPLYQLLVDYAAKVVQFSGKGQELLSLEDNEFLHLRLKETEQRIRHIEREWVKIEQATADFKVFFNTLNKKEYKDSSLHHLPEPVKKTLATHYKLLEPYVKNLDFELNNKIISALTDHAWQHTLNPLTLFSKLSIEALLELHKKIAAELEKDANTQQLHLQLNEDLIDSVYEQADLSLYPNKTTTNLLASDEARVLKIDQAKLTKFNFNIDGADYLVDKPKALNSEQAFELYEFYTDKLNRLKRAKTAYEQFMTLIHANKPKILKDIASETKAILRKLYCCFQPYMIEIRTQKLNFNNYDKLIIAHFSGNELPKLQRITTNYFERTEKSVVDTFNEFIHKSQQRTDLYRNLAGKKFRKESQQRVLKPDYSTNERSEYLLKNTEYSKAISELRDSLFQLTPLFNRAAQEALKPVINKLPFPELKDQNDLLAQSKQLIGIKQLFNSLYHLEKITNQLEALNNKSSQTIYVYHLGQAYSHILGIVDAAEELSKDPYLAFIAPEITQRASQASDFLLQQSEPYRVNPGKVTLRDSKNKEEVKYGGIWYPLNAFMLIPAQINKLKSEAELTTQERQRIQSHTKEVVINIENIIASTSSYFRLFLQAPVLYELFQEFKEKLNQFTTLSHEAVISNLKEINEELFSKILIETDKCEDSIGLLPGQFSGPMKLLLDEFYKGLVEPLGLVSQRNIALISKQATIDRRIAALKERKTKAQTQLKIHQHDYAFLKQLMDSINTFIQFTKLPPQPIVFAEITRNLIRNFKNALPILDKNSALFTLLKGEIEKSPEIDKVLNGTENTLAHCKLIFNYYKGLIATHELEIQTAKEKGHYLNLLREQQPSVNRQCLREYTEVTLKRQMETILDKDIGLIHLQNEYQVKLKEYLENGKRELITITQSADNIDEALRIKINEKIKGFENFYYSRYAHLESVIGALDQFKNYLIKAETELQNEESTFENAKTLAKKSSLISRLEKIALNKNLSIGERFQKLHELAEQLQFEETFLACSEPQFFTLEWLTRLVTSFLQLLHLYKPAHIDHYETLTQSLKTLPELISNPYRLFKPAEANRRYALPQLTLYSGVDETIPNPEGEEIELNL